MALKFRDFLEEINERDKSVPTEFKIAIGQLKRMYNPDETPSLKDLEKDVEIIAKKNHLDVEKFLEFAKTQFKINESAVGKPGRTTLADAEEHINDDLIADFKKIVKKLGGKTVAKALIDKLGNNSEISDEIKDLEKVSESADINKVFKNAQIAINNYVKAVEALKLSERQMRQFNNLIGSALTDLDESFDIFADNL